MSCDTLPRGKGSAANDRTGCPGWGPMITIDAAPGRAGNYGRMHHLYHEPVDELQWGQHQRGAAIRLSFGQVVHQPVRVDGLQLLQGERRAGTIAQQPLEPGPIIGLDSDRGIDRIWRLKIYAV